MEEKHYSLQKFREQTMDDPDLMCSIAALFSKNIGNETGQMADALQKEEYELLRRLAHKAKSGFIVMGAETLHAKALEIENEAKKANAAGTLASLVADYTAKCHQLSAQLTLDFPS